MQAIDYSVSKKIANKAEDILKASIRAESGSLHEVIRLHEYLSLALFHASDDEDTLHLQFPHTAYAQEFGPEGSSVRLQLIELFDAVAEEMEKEAEST